MWSLEFLLVVTCSLFSYTASASHSSRRSYPHSRSLQTRNIVTDGTLSDSYDFVVVGGGLAGLVLANRLSEDSNATVLVLEAGDTGEAVRANIDPPAATYYTSLVGSSYDWAFKTAPQSNAGGRALSWPRGKVLGGSSAINGMYFVRPSEIEVDAWSKAISSDDSAAAGAWSWDQFFTAMKKSETFTPPSSDIQSTAGIKFDASSYGTSGPLHVSYPGLTFPVVGDWSPSLESIGISTSSDPSGGQGWGGFVAALNINPTNWTRSYSKSAYLDPLPPRSNLDVFVKATVTRIIFDSSPGDLTATAVEFASSAGAAKKTVKVNKEVILAGGVVGSPHVLMHSGVGPKDVLEAAGVPVKVELPGVGQHLQDHLAAGVVWETSTQTPGAIKASGSDVSSSPEFMSFVNSATAYVNLTTMLGPDGVAPFQKQVLDALDASASSLVPSKYPEVIEGYKTIYEITANTILPSPVGQIELLLSINAPGTIAIQAAIQHPFSQGRIYINSASAFDPPVVDPQYFSHFADISIMREGLKLARKLGQSAPIRELLGTEVAPGPNVNTDDEWNTWLAANSGTEFHPTGTCAMLPKSQGGVVNAKLQVYGLANVRVADASVYPIEFSAHLGAPTYGLAEQAANIIRASHNGVSPPATSVSPTVNLPAQSSQAPNGAHTGQGWGLLAILCVVFPFLAGISF